MKKTSINKLRQLKVYHVSGIGDKNTIKIYELLMSTFSNMHITILDNNNILFKCNGEIKIQYEDYNKELIIQKKIWHLSL
jgi:hypothetical protein